jgi:tRNA (cmo5U34)-methyltransferase
VATFSDLEAVSRYAEGPARLVPGFRDLQRMTAILLGEKVGENAHILVLGAGGGLELKALADLHSGWRFVGVDPSSEMLELAAQTIGRHATRVHLHEGYIHGAPKGPFDGATCLLTLHFVPREERRRTLAGLRERLKPGAPLVVAHHSFPQGDGKALWLERYAAYAAASGVAGEQARNAAEAIGARLPVLSPEEDEAMLRDAGFMGASLFYAGFTFRGWVAFAP